MARRVTSSNVRQIYPDPDGFFRRFYKKTGNPVFAWLALCHCPLTPAWAEDYLDEAMHAILDVADAPDLTASEANRRILRALGFVGGRGETGWHQGFRRIHKWADLAARHERASHSGLRGAAGKVVKKIASETNTTERQVRRRLAEIIGLRRPKSRHKQGRQ